MVVGPTIAIRTKGRKSNTTSNRLGQNMYKSRTRHYSEYSRTNCLSWFTIFPILVLTYTVSQFLILLVADMWSFVFLSPLFQVIFTSQTTQMMTMAEFMNNIIFFCNITLLIDHGDGLDNDRCISIITPSLKGGSLV